MISVMQNTGLQCCFIVGSVDVCMYKASLPTS